MEENPRLFKYFIVRFIIFTLLSAAILVLHAPLVIIYLKYFIGCLLLFYAFDELLIDALYKRKNFFHNEKIYLALVELVLALTVLCGELLPQTIYVIWATWSIIRESYEVKEIFCDFKNITPRVLSGVESVVVIVFSIMLIVEPVEHHALVHSYLLVAELIVTSLVPILEMFITKKKKPKEQQNG